jgi:hypothetical protein
MIVLLDSFLKWCREYNLEITWFIIGFLISCGLDGLEEGNYIISTINFLLAYVNYKCYTKGL